MKKVTEWERRERYKRGNKETEDIYDQGLNALQQLVSVNFLDPTTVFFSSFVVRNTVISFTSTFNNLVAFAQDTMAQVTINVNTACIPQAN